MLYARRPLARRLLSQATKLETPLGHLRVVSVEGLIGFKLQGYANDATRTRDLNNIRALVQVQVHRASLDITQLREYFALFDQQKLLHELIEHNE